MRSQRSLGKILQAHSHAAMAIVMFWGRATRNRLFSTEEVYRAALIFELIKLGLPPSSASDAINELWKGWWAKELSEGKKVFAMMVPTGDKWSASMCWQKSSGGPFYKCTKQLGFNGSVQTEMPSQAFLTIPINNVFRGVTERLTVLLSN